MSFFNPIFPTPSGIPKKNHPGPPAKSRTHNWQIPPSATSARILGVKNPGPTPHRNVFGFGKDFGPPPTPQNSVGWGGFGGKNAPVFLGKSGEDGVFFFPVTAFSVGVPIGFQKSGPPLKFWTPTAWEPWGGGGGASFFFFFPPPPTIPLPPVPPTQPTEGKKGTEKKREKKGCWGGKSPRGPPNTPQFVPPPHIWRWGLQT